MSIYQKNIHKPLHRIIPTSPLHSSSPQALCIAPLWRAAVQGIDLCRVLTYVVSYRLSDKPEEELATAIDRYHLQQLMQDDDTPMDDDTIDELAYDAYLLAQDSEKLGKKEQAMKYYEQAQKWSEMPGGEEEECE